MQEEFFNDFCLYIAKELIRKKEGEKTEKEIFKNNITNY